MNILSREFTRNEKILIAVLAVLLVGLAYYWFVYTTVSTGIQQAESEASALEVQLSGLQTKLDTIRRMEEELATIEENGDVSVMGSYNNSEAELRALNSILSSTDAYTISFADVTREGDQVRRDFSLQFTASSFENAKQVMRRLADCEWRCLVDNISCSPASSNSTRTSGDNWSGQVQVSATATFFETMVGGEPDDALPNESST